jgi:hypothetical protein
LAFHLQTGVLDLDYLNPNPSPGPGFLLQKICKLFTVSGSRSKDPTQSGYTTLPKIKYRIPVSPGIDLGYYFYRLINQCFSGERSLLAGPKSMEQKRGVFLRSGPGDCETGSVFSQFISDVI